MVVVVCGFATHTSLTPDNAKPIEAVRMLVSESLDEPERGKQLILRERRELISQLSAIVSDPQNHVRHPYSVEKAMSVLGELRAPEGTKVLVTYIGFPHVHHPEAGEYPGLDSSGGDLNKTIEQLLPAVPALIKIGEPCIDEVIKKLSTADNLLEIKACQTVLKKLNQPPSVRARLERAIEGAAPRKREQLRKTLEILDLPPTPKTK